MNPLSLFPLLAVAFGLLAAWQFARLRRFGPAVRTWLLLALIFGAVSLWLHRESGREVAQGEPAVRLGTAGPG